MNRERVDELMAGFSGLLGWEIVRVGLRDGTVGVESVEALLVEIAGSRLRVWLCRHRAAR